MENKKILITGIAGFIGSHLADELLARGYKVCGIDNLSMGKIENIEHNLSNPQFVFKKIDVRNLSLLKETASDSVAIVHLAAFKIPRYGNSLDTLLINTKGTENVFEVAKEIGCKVIFASTSDVYGKNPNLPFKEDSNLVYGPSNIARWSYAVSKLFDEHMAFGYQESFGIPVVILRFFGAYGPRQHLSWWGGPQSVFISAILKDEEIQIHGDGTQRRTFIYIEDLIYGVMAAIERKDAIGEIFNLGTTEEISILDLARLIKKLCDTKDEIRLKFVPYSSLSSNYEDVRRRIPDIAKAQSILGFQPKINLREGIKMTIGWQRNILGKIPVTEK
ncbi:MAG: GDP-mannose 4,6-dehydratase [Candidatus Omnitrophota bacterium]